MEDHADHPLREKSQHESEHQECDRAHAPGNGGDDRHDSARSREGSDDDPEIAEEAQPGEKPGTDHGSGGHDQGHAELSAGGQAECPRPGEGIAEEGLELEAGCTECRSSDKRRNGPRDTEFEEYGAPGGLVDPGADEKRIT